MPNTISHELTSMNNIISFEQTKTLGEELQRQGKYVVLTGGCFDLLHIGHITLLEKAREQGDILIVLLESDKRITKLKGSDRPLHTQRQRAHMLSSLRPVDYIILLPDSMTDADYDAVVKQLQPAIIATTQGSDSMQYIQEQANMVGAGIFLVEPMTNMSTSRIVDIVTKEF